MVLIARVAATTAEGGGGGGNNGDGNFGVRPRKSDYAAGDGGPAVGAAELSPVEMEGVVLAAVPADDRSASHPRVGEGLLYVTDVVTHQSYRRMGVGAALMRAIERVAQGRFGGRRLFLHVRRGNDAAMRFYTSPDMGYRPFPGDDREDEAESEGLDLDRLAKNAGAVGQILLSKKLSSTPTTPVARRRAGTDPRGASGGGFGGGTAPRKSKLKRRRR